MDKPKGKSGNKGQSGKDYLNLVTALVNLLIALILLIEKMNS